MWESGLLRGHEDSCSAPLFCFSLNVPFFMRTRDTFVSLIWLDGWFICALGILTLSSFQTYAGLLYECQQY